MKRLFASKARALIALGTLTALLAVATLKPLPRVWGQEKEAPTRKVEQKAEEKAEKKTEEPAPVKDAEPKNEGNGEKTEKEPVKGEEKTPEKTPEGKAPMKEEGRVPRKTEGKDPVKGEEKVPMKKEEGKIPEGRPVPRKGDPEVSKDPLPGRVRPVPGKEMKEPGEGKRPVPGKEVPKVTPKVVIDGLPENFEEMQRTAYDRLEHKDLTFEKYLDLGKQAFQRMRNLEKNPALRYQSGKRGGARLHPVCPNGDFEIPFAGTDVNPGEWSGANGLREDNSVGGDIPGSFIAGLVSGPIVNTGINTGEGHQTIVSAGTDPHVPIQMTGPNTSSNVPSSHAVRIGNAEIGGEVDILSKTFVVTPSDTLIKFWYAVVMQNPTDHPPQNQPNFEVRVLDASNPSSPLTGLVNLGGNSSKLIADAGNPFFLKVLDPGPDAEAGDKIVYTDWKCAQLDLSRQVGKTVTVEFITRDCSQKGHWCYAYLDNFCGNCTDSQGGDIAFDPETSSECGRGQVCYNYTLPTTHDVEGNVLTGTAEITLEIWQGGALLQTLPTSPPTLSDGRHVCFPIDRTTIPGIAPGGFDLVAKGVFTLGTYVTTLNVGTAPNGQILGPNNDYDNPRICPTGTPGTIVYDDKTSTHCGKGQICFSLRLPTMKDKEGNMITATGEIHLTLYKGVVAVVSLPASPVLNDKTGTRYCFPIDPANIPGLNPGGFDFVATAVFSFGTSATVGTVPTGIIPGPNNDYNDPRICPEDPPKPKDCGCCPGENLVKDGDFEQFGGEIGSEYKWAQECSKLFPGTYSVGHVDKIGQCCSNWILPKECKGTKNFYENVLIVNGQTNQPAGSTAVIWEQQIVLPSDAGLEGADYRLCFRYLPLPQCCFDIQAKPYILVNGGRIPLTDDCDEDTGCGHLFAATFHGAGTVSVQIVLPEDGKGDGNDLLIDNISIVKIVPVPANLLTFSPDAENVVNGMFDVTSVIAPGLASTCTWDWELYRGHAPDVMDPALFTLVQPSTQSNQPTSTFTGVPINDGNGKPILYWVKLTVECECSRGAVYRPAGQFSKSLKLEGKSIADPHPQRVKRGKAVPAPVPAAAKRSE